MADNILKDFLVNIGFKVDNSSSKKADAEIDKKEASLNKIGKAEKTVSNAHTTATNVQIKNTKATNTEIIKSGKLREINFLKDQQYAKSATNNVIKYISVLKTIPKLVSTGGVAGPAQGFFDLFATTSAAGGQIFNILKSRYKQSSANAKKSIKPNFSSITQVKGGSGALGGFFGGGRGGGGGSSSSAFEDGEFQKKYSIQKKETNAISGAVKEHQNLNDAVGGLEAQKSQRGFLAFMTSSAAVATGVGAAIGGVAIAATEMFKGFEASIGQLSIMADAAGTTATNLKALGQAGEQIGLGAASAEQLAVTLNTLKMSSPGIVTALKNLGITSTDTVEQLAQLATHFHTLYASGNSARANAEGGLLGISPTQVALMADKFKQFNDVLHDSENTLNAQGFDQHAADALEFTNRIEDLKNSFFALSDRIINKVKPAFDYLFNTIVPGFQGALHAGGPFLDFATNLWHVIDKLSGATLAWFGLVVKTFEYVGKALGWLLEHIINPVLDKFTKVIGFVEKLLGIKSGSETVANAIPAGATAPPAKSVHDNGPPVSNQTTQTAKNKSLPRGLRNNNPGNIEAGAFATKEGATGSDGRFAIFPTLAAGIKAHKDLLLGKGYIGGGRNTIAKIIQKYAPSSENDDSAYIASVSKNAGIGANDTITPDKLNAVVRAMELHENGQKYSGYLNNAADNVASLKGGKGTTALTGLNPSSQIGTSTSVTNNINVKSDIAVNGAGDPSKTAHTINNSQTRQLGDLIRNSLPVMQ
jgi:hypothetical protein